MAKEFHEVQKDVGEMYKHLSQIADDIIKKNTDNISKVIKEIENNVETLTVAQLRTYTLKLATMAYSLGDKVEHADLKRECASAILKEANAEQFNLASGAVAAKQTTALLNTRNEQAVSILYNMVADSLKTKLQMTNRMIDSIKNVLISRTAEAKIETQLFPNKEA